MSIIKNNWRNAIKIILFSILVISMLGGILSIFNYKDMGGGGGFQRFYQADKNSIDVLFFGSSHAHCTIDHGLLWDQYGMAGYTLSAGSQEIDSTYYFVKEALEKQTPKVIVVEVLGATGGEIYNDETVVYRNTLGMEWSGNFTEYMTYLKENMKMEDTWAKEVFAKIPIIHSRYTELTQADFYDNISFMRGYRGSFDVVRFERPTAADNTEFMELNSERQQMLQNIIDTAKEHNVSIVLIASPFILEDSHQMYFNAVEELAKENQIPFINYNKLYDEINIDFQRDFRDVSHVNNYGAKKVTTHLAEFLKQNYDIPDRRGQKGYELWDENALYLRNKWYRHELENAENINSYLQKLTESEDEQITIIALTGNYNALGEVYFEKLSELGITREQYETGGAFVLKGNALTDYLSGKEYGKCFKTQNGEIHLESSIYQTEDGESRDDVKMLINGQNYRMVENGVNIVVYNETINQLIDAAGDDVYLGLELVHNEKPEE